jgi:hypothetical protein
MNEHVRIILFGSLSLIIEIQGEYLRLKPQDESDNIDTFYRRWHSLCFPIRTFNYQSLQKEVRSGRNGADSERPSEAALPPLMRQYPKHQHGERECQKRSSVLVGRASPKITPSPSTCQRLPAGKNNRWESPTPRIGVPAVWHRQSATDHDDRVRRVPAKWRSHGCKPETPTARDSSAFRRRRMSIASPFGTRLPLLRSFHQTFS